MKDPFFIQPIPWLSDSISPLSQRLNLLSLPLHIHEVVFSALFYFAIFYIVSPPLSSSFAPRHYSRLSRKKRLNWDAHVVSFVQSTLINALALWIMAIDDERQQMDADARVWGYTGAAGMIQAMAAGYFVWDLIVTSLNLDVFGIGTLAHAVAALTVFSLGFRPFVNYYGCIFILWELSTPFLNIHWFLDKMDLTGSRLQLYNGIVLLFTFFCCRLVFGTYQSYRVFSDIWLAVGRKPSMLANDATEVMLFANDESVIPSWLAFSYLASNITLNSLNFYWFFMMVRAVRKRFVPNTQIIRKAQLDDSRVAQVDWEVASLASGVAQMTTLLLPRVAELGIPLQRRLLRAASSETPPSFE